MNWIRKIFDRIGAPAGASVSADIATLKGEVDKFQYGAVGSGDINIIYPDVDQPASAIEYSLAELTDDFIADVEITAVGTIDIYRFRKGTDAGWTSIVASGVMGGTGLGSINYSYTFPNASWAVGDMVQIHINGVQVTVNASVFTMPRKTIYGVVGVNQLLQGWVTAALTKLIGVADGAGNFPASVIDQSILSKILSKVAGGDTSSYDETTDSLEMLSDKVGAYTGDGGAGADDSVKAELDLIKTQTDKLAGAAPTASTTTANWNTATGTSGESGEDLVTIGADDTKYKLHSLILSVNALTNGAIITVKFFMQVNGTERCCYRQNFTVDTTTPGIVLIDSSWAIHEALRIEVYSNTSENVAIAYDYMLEAM